MPTDTIPSIETLLERAISLRPMLREQQAACEERSYPSREVYEAFKAAGFYRVLTPKVFGGYEKSLREYYSLVIEIAKGCPSTGWWFALGAAHAVQISSYCAPETQRKVFAFDPDFSGPWTWTAPKATIRKEGDGYRLSGTWHFASGGPHSSFMMAGLSAPVEGFDDDAKMTALVPRGSYEILEDWGDIIGVRGSGSNSVRIDNIFVPADMLFEADSKSFTIGETAGSAFHRNPFYGGLFRGFAEGGLSCVAVGTGLAAIEEYSLSMAARRSIHKPNLLRAEDPDFQRKLGLALVAVEAARAITLSGADLYLKNSELAVSGKEAFDETKADIMDGMYHTAEGMVYDAIESLARSSSSSALRDGQRMQRYFRDILTLTSRGDFFEFRAANLARNYLVKERFVAARATAVN